MSTVATIRAGSPRGRLLNHANITAIYDIGSDQGAPYVVQELLEGETLRNRLAGGAFTPRRAIGHALQIAQDSLPRTKKESCTGT